MANWAVYIRGKGVRKASVEKLAKKLKEELGGEIMVVDNTPPESRADCFDICKSGVNDAKDEAERLKDELQDWYDNLPENFQYGEKGESLESAISQLDEFIDGCDSALNVDVDFPGMY